MLTKALRLNSIGTILVLAALIRIGAAVYWESKLGDGQSFQFGDSDGYWHLASTIGRGDSYDYNSPHARVFRTPGYPILLSPLFLVTEQPPVWAARLIGVLLGVISIFLLWLLARKLFDDSTPVAAAWIAAFYPGAISISILVLAEALFVPLMLAQFLCWLMAFRSPKIWSWAVLSLLSGIFFGAACLTRPSWLLFVPFLLVGGLVFFGRRKRQVSTLAMVVPGCVLVMFPWWVRNYEVTGRFVLTSLQTGTSLYDGWNPEATGASNMAFAPKMKAASLKEWKLAGRPEREFEFAFNEQMKKRAFEWARENPGRVAELAWIKLKRIWSPLPNSREIGSKMVRFAIALFFLPVLLLALVGAWRVRGDGMAMAICVGPAVYFTLLHMVFVGSIRYRHPPMMTLLILAAAVLATWFGRKSCNRDGLSRQMASQTVVGESAAKK